MNNGLSDKEASDLFQEVYDARVKGASLHKILEEPTAAVQAEAPVETTEVVPEPAVPEVVTPPEPPPVQATETTKVEEVKPEVVAEPVPEPQARDLSWIKDLPDDLKAKVVKLEEERRLNSQQYRSNAGRISAYQRTIAQLKSELARVPLQTTIPAAKLETDEDFKTLAENDPKFAAYLKKTLERAMNQASQETAKAVDARLKATFEPMFQAQQDEYKQEQRAFLESEIPEVDKIVNSDSFQNWFKKEAEDGNSEVIRMLDSPHAHHVIKAMRLYDVETGSNSFATPYVPYAQVVAKPVAQVPVTPPVVSVTEQANKIAAARAAKSGTAGGIGAGAATPTGGDGSLDEDALFLSAYNLAKKR